MCPDGSSMGKIFRLLLGGPSIGYQKSKQSDIVQATGAANAKRPITPEEVAAYIGELDEEIRHKSAKIRKLDAAVIEIAMRGESQETVAQLTQVIRERRGLRTDLKRKQGMRATVDRIDSGLAQPASNAKFLDLVSRAGVTLERQNPDHAVERVDAAMERLREGLNASDAVSSSLGDAIESQESLDEMSIEEEIRAAFASASAAKAQTILSAATPVPVAAPARASPVPAPRSVSTSVHTPQTGYVAPRPGTGHYRSSSTALAVHPSSSTPPGMDGFDAV